MTTHGAADHRHDGATDSADASRRMNNRTPGIHARAVSRSDHPVLDPSYVAESIASISAGEWMDISSLDPRQEAPVSGRMLGFRSGTGAILTASDIAEVKSTTDWVWQFRPSITLMLVLGDGLTSWVDGFGEHGYRHGSLVTLSFAQGGHARTVAPSGYCGLGLGLELPLAEDGRGWLGQDDAIAARLRRIASRPGISRQVADPALVALAETVRVSPFSGVLRNLFLESCSIDLVLRLLGNDAGPCHAEPIEAREKRKLIEARELLAGQLQDPPCLAELAHSVGLNGARLKSGFKAMFGVTIFAFVRQERMRMAYEMLAEGENIKKVAYLAGYNSPKNFTTSFRHYFGTVPSTVRSTSATTMRSVR